MAPEIRLIAYNGEFHGISQHHSHTVACAHAYRLQAPCEGVAFRIETGISYSVILMFADDTDHALVSMSEQDEFEMDEETDAVRSPYALTI